MGGRAVVVPHGAEPAASRRMPADPRLRVQLTADHPVWDVSADAFRLSAAGVG